MIALPEANCTVTQVLGGGDVEDYDTPEGPDNVKWSGQVRGYMVEGVSEVLTGTSVSDVETHRVIVPFGALDDVADPDQPVRQGDDVVMVYRGDERTFRIQAVASSRLGGSTSLTLWQT